ncbi:CvpA family protein, partial [Desulfovibrio sp. OttesenSCG-928-C06]|nr:CvpA family protein [Desulfovibrio sp. OttesenSCG-928-C06]
MNLPPLDSINFLDLLLGGLLLVFAVRGLLRGLIAELTGLVGVVLGIAVAGNSHVHGWTVDVLHALLNDSAWSNLLAYLLSFAAS